MSYIRHLGKIVNTGQRCVVVFMQIPNREDHALIISVDSLPLKYQQAVMEILNSKEGQAEEVFANALSRRCMPDSNKTVLVTLHESKMLEAIHISKVIMTPAPNMPVPLTKVLQDMGRFVPDTDASLNETTKFNPYEHNVNAGNQEEKLGVAKNLIIEAELLENEAKNKRLKAYAISPELEPIKEVKLTQSKESKTTPKKKIVVHKKKMTQNSENEKTI